MHTTGRGGGLAGCIQSRLRCDKNRKIPLSVSVCLRIEYMNTDTEEGRNRNGLRREGRGFILKTAHLLLSANPRTTHWDCASKTGKHSEPAQTLPSYHTLRVCTTAESLSDRIFRKTDCFLNESTRKREKTLGARTLRLGGGVRRGSLMGEDTLDDQPAAATATHPDAHADSEIRPLARSEPPR